MINCFLGEKHPDKYRPLDYSYWILRKNQCANVGVFVWKYVHFCYWLSCWYLRL